MSMETTTTTTPRRKTSAVHRDITLAHVPGMRVNIKIYTERRWVDRYVLLAAEGVDLDELRAAVAEITTSDIVVVDSAANIAKYVPPADLRRGYWGVVRDDEVPQ